MIAVPGYDQFGGRHCETGSLKNVLGYLGVTDPYTGAPFTEEMLLGIGGGIGVAYWLFEFGDYPFVFIGTRYSEKSPGPEFLQEICHRVTAKANLSETASPKKGYSDLKAALEDGRPAIAWGDMPALPYLGLPEQAHFGGHTFVVYGIDEAKNEAYIADRAKAPVRASLAELAAARASSFKPFPPKHKLLDVEPPASPVKKQTVERAIIRGISDCCRRMLNPPIANFGLKGLKKWADLVANQKSAKGWPAVFSDGFQLYSALLYTFMSIEIGGTGGSAFRSMYADFLEEVSSALDEADFKNVAGLYRECAKGWSAIGVCALPDSVEPFKKTRKLLLRKNELFEQQPSGALDKMLGINQEIEVLMRDLRKEFPLTAKQIQELLGSLRESILDVHDKEARAVKALQELIK